MGMLRVLFALIRNILADRAELVTENLALRQQLAILEHKSKRPRLRKRDRIFRAWLSHLWPKWQRSPRSKCTGSSRRSTAVAD